MPRQSATKLRLVETDDSTGSWWSLLDVSAADGGTALDESDWTATGVVRQTQDAAGALDESTAAWSSGAPIADREASVVVDLSGMVTLTQVDVTHDGSDYPTAMDVEVFDGTAWTTVATDVAVSSGTTSVAVSDQTASKLRLVETDDTTTNWWTIADVSADGY